VEITARAPSIKNVHKSDKKKKKESKERKQIKKVSYIKEADSSLATSCSNLSVV
jgi:hypothetical protein